MAHLNVNTADLLRAADDYAELQMRAAAIGPNAVDEVNRIIATHGPMGYPVVIGVVDGLARRTAALDAQAAQFGQYSNRFTEHAAAYTAQDHDNAQNYDGSTDLLDFAGPGIDPPTGRVICTEINLGGFACSEFLPGGMIYHWLSPADLTGHWPDFP